MKLKLQNQIAKILVIIGIITILFGMWNEPLWKFLVVGIAIILAGLTVMPFCKKGEENE